MFTKYLKYFLHTDSSEKCYKSKLHLHYIVLPGRGFLQHDFVYLKARFLFVIILFVSSLAIWHRQQRFSFIYLGSNAFYAQKVIHCPSLGAKQHRAFDSESS